MPFFADHFTANIGQHSLAGWRGGRMCRHGQEGTGRAERDD